MLSVIERVLQTYTLEEILELNEITEEEALLSLVNSKLVKLPNPSPVDMEM